MWATNLASHAVSWWMSVRRSMALRSKLKIVMEARIGGAAELRFRPRRLRM